MNSQQMEAIKAGALPGAVIGVRPAPTKNLIRKFVSWQIRSAQKRTFPKAPRISPAAVEVTHVLQYFSPDEVWEFTWPKARRISLYQVEGEIYGFANVRPAAVGFVDSVDRWINAEAEKVMLSSWREIEGERYDYLDLLDFLLYEKLKYPRALTPVFSALLGIGRKNFVCSTVIAYHYRLCHKLVAGFPNVLAATPFELTMPAHFFLSPKYFDFHGLTYAG